MNLHSTGLPVLKRAAIWLQLLSVGGTLPAEALARAADVCQIALIILKIVIGRYEIEREALRHDGDKEKENDMPKLLFPSEPEGEV